MAATTILPYVRGIDLSKYDFSDDSFPSDVGQMTGLRWLKLNRVNIERVPEVLSSLKNLEHLQLTHNKLTSVHGELSDLPCLRSVILRNNQIKISGIPTDIFLLPDLTVVDLSHNSLKEVPTNLDRAKCIIALNLAHNHLESVPNHLFVNMSSLIYLDLSYNNLTILPPQIRRLTDLQVLKLSGNPMVHFQLKQLPSMVQLRVLHMRRTMRNAANIPATLDNLVNLEDLDLSGNELSRVPDALYSLNKLRKLNLSDNQIEEVAQYGDCWPSMEVINLSRNKIRALPDAFTRMTSLKLLFVNENQLDFEGIPAGIGKLVNLEVFQAAYNNLELVPEGLCRCVKLRKVKLNNNRLITMPASIYLLSDLSELDVRNNPDLTMPPKPTERKGDLAFYNIDFSLEHQKHLAGSSQSSSANSSVSSVSKDPVARKIQFLRRRKGQTEADSDQKKILKGMSDVAKEREKVEEALEGSQDSMKPIKQWEKSLEKPTIDYSGVFEPHTGQEVGLSVFEIDNFLPNPLEAVCHGKFYEGDCYIVLDTFLDDSGQLNWKIYYWIGAKASLDKKACAAIHAVNLRNFLGADCRTIREEMNDESNEFLELFSDEILYIEGGRTASGFYAVEPAPHRNTLHRIYSMGTRIFVQSVPVRFDSLDPRYAYLLDLGSELFVWYGKKSKLVTRTKARLFAEKVNKTERKGFCEVEMIAEGQETSEFWQALTNTGAPPDEPVIEHDSYSQTQFPPKLYRVCLGMGYLELPRVQLKATELKQAVLKSKYVYILDCFTELFIWIGTKSARLVRRAGIQLAAELLKIIHRPEHVVVSNECEGTETMMFKSKFVGWDDVIAVDFTRTAESVQRRGVDLKVILERDKMKTDLAALFRDRQPVLSDEASEDIMEECNEDLEFMESFVLQGKKFVRLPEKEFGTFYSTDCYVFLCRYWVLPEEGEGEASAEHEPDSSQGATAGGTRESSVSSEKGGEKAAGESEGDGEDEADAHGESKPDYDFQCVVYFWQGRDASNMGWLTFTFSLQKKFESLFKEKLEVVRMYQQQENQKFLSHFRRKLVIHRGRRSLAMFSGSQWPELYQIRANGSLICTRTVQMDVSSELLNSEFCHILKVPFHVPDEDGARGRVFVWEGKRAPTRDAALAADIAKSMLNAENWPVQCLDEGSEPEAFWDALGGKKPYDTDANFMRYSRLFRCSNDRGYFVVSEKTIDFCQDDLNDDDVMILDNGDQVFIWIGGHAPEVELKLAYKAAQVYIKHLATKTSERPRKLFATLKGKESKRFTKCFQGWTQHKHPAGDLA